MPKELPEAKYTIFGEKIRHVIPGPMQCSMACGGRSCKWENPARWSDKDQVIKGVFSSWVLEDVVAMSRPSTEVIMKYDLIKQFKDNDISSIINLQRPGEHASCGPPLHKESQFTYDPHIFMDNDIFFYNFGWKDYGVTSLETILDMVKVMAFTLSEGKVAVHCHAGLGRTGVLIACYLVYAQRMDASSAINTIRKQRPNSIQTRGQIACIQEFAQFLKPLRIVFPQVFPHGDRLTLVQFLHRQRHILHGFESRELRFTPKIVHIICQRLAEIATTSHDMGLFEERKRSGHKTRSAKRKKTPKRCDTVEILKIRVPGAFVNERLDSNDIDPLDSQELNAILSPRVSRKCDSAKSRQGSCESTSLSRPESPTRHLFGTPTPSTKPESVGLKRVIPPQPVFEESSITGNDDTESSCKSPVLVEQVSRSRTLSLVTNPPQLQTGVDNNMNNNNQMVMHLHTQRSQSFSIGENPYTEVPVVNKDQQVYLSVETGFECLASNAPSPTPSLHEPQPLPRVDVKRQNMKGAGHKLQIGKQKMVQPTGMPTRGRLLSRSDAKDKGCVEVTAKKGNDEPLQVHAVVENVSSTDDNREVINDADIPEMTQSPETVAPYCEKDRITTLMIDPADQELEEITEIKDNIELFLSESEEEDLKSCEKQKSKSAASKVSWSEGDNVNGEEEIQCIGKNENMSFMSTGTEIQYRTQKPLECAANLETDDNSDGHHSDEERCADAVKEDMVPDQLSSANSLGIEVRPKSASFLKRMVEKRSDGEENQVNSLTATQSLCDLRKHDEISCDDLAMMKAEMTSEIFFPLASTAEGNGSDDVCSPTGSTCKRRIKDPITVAMALAYKLTDNEWLWEKVYAKQVELNTRDDAWSSIEQEDDTHLLSCLMWSWIEHLSEPVIKTNEVERLINNSYDNDGEYPDPKLFDEALASLGKPVSSTVRCVLHCLGSLPPLSVDLELSVIKRLTSAFMQIRAVDKDEDSDECCKADSLHKQFVFLIQHYLEEMRREIHMTRCSVDDKEQNKSNDTSSTGQLKSKPMKTARQRSGSFGKGEGDGDTSPSTSKVSELPARIRVS